MFLTDIWENKAIKGCARYNIQDFLSRLQKIQGEARF